MNLRAILAGSVVGCLCLASAARAQQVVTYLVSVPQASTDWTQPLALPGFDSSLGTLSQVKLTYSGEIWQTLEAENMSSTNTATYDLSSSATLTIGRSSGPTLFDDTATPVVFHQTGALGTYDGTLDFAGSSGVTLNQNTAINGTYLDPNLNTYISGSPIDFSASALSTDSLTMHGGNGADGAQTEAAASLRVDYTYTPIPEPAAFAAVVGLVALGGVLRRRREVGAPLVGS